MTVAYNLFFTAACMATGSALTLLYLRLQEEDESRKKKEEVDENPDPPVKAATSRSIQSRSIAIPAPKKSKHEDLLTGIISQLWPYVNPAICAVIRESVEPTFAELPGPLASMRFLELDLGKDPLVVENMIVHPLKDGVVQFDMDVDWVAKCKIKLKADYVGSLGVQTIKFSGRMAFVMKPLTKVLPCVSAVQFYFIDPPNLHLDFTGLAQVADLKVIKKQVLQTVMESLKGMMVAPNYYQATKLDENTNFFEMYQAPIGVARITLVRGEGFKDEVRHLRKADIPDVYCKITLGASETYKSRMIKDNREPVWSRDDYCDFVLYDYGQTITVEAWDEDTGPMDTDDLLGSSQITVRDLLVAASNRTVTLPLLEKGEPNDASITIRCDLVSLTTDLKSLTSPPISPWTLGGLLTIQLDRANLLELSTEEMPESTMARVTYGEKVFETGYILGHTPLFEVAYQVPISTEQFSKNGGNDIVFDLIPFNGTSMGTITVLHSTLMRANDSTITETQKIGTSGASLRYRVSMSGVETKEPEPNLAIAEDFAVSDSFRVEAPAPIVDEPAALEDHGTVKVTAVSGRDFAVVKRRLRKDDIPDIYLAIRCGKEQKNSWRTKIIKDKVDPVFNESHAFVMSSPDEIIEIEAFNANKVRNDVFVGSAKVPVGQLLLAGGSMELPLKEKDKATGAFVTIKCEKMGA